jgi:hypothetical protein
MLKASKPQSLSPMHRIVIAFRAFFVVLFNRVRAEQVERALDAGAAKMVEPQSPQVISEKPPDKAPPKPARKAAARNDAINLLAAMQREARLVDFFKEPIAGYSDAQIGAAVRDVHRDCAALLDRLFGLKPIESAAEGAEIEIREGFDPARIRLVGNVAGQPPFRGRLCHHGWEALRCDLPEWTGSERSMLVVSPAEVELR